MRFSPEQEKKFMEGKNLQPILDHLGITSLNDLPRDRFFVVHPDGSVTSGTPNPDGSYSFEFGAGPVDPEG